MFPQPYFRLAVCLQASFSKKRLYQKDSGALTGSMGAPKAGCWNGRKPPALESWTPRSPAAVSQWALGLLAGLAPRDEEPPTVPLCVLGLLAQEWKFQERGSSEPSLNCVRVWVLWFLQQELKVREEDYLSSKWYRMRTHQKGEQGAVTQSGEGWLKAGGWKMTLCILTRWWATWGQSQDPDYKLWPIILWLLFTAINTVQNLLKGLILCRNSLLLIIKREMIPHSLVPSG